MRASATIVLVSLLALTVMPAPAADEATAGRPRIEVRRARLLPSGGPLLLGVAVREPDDVRSVTAWVRGERDSAFQAFPLVLRREPQSQFVAEIPAWSTRGDRVSYFIETYDKASQRPARLGSPEQPIALGGLAADGAGLEARGYATLWQLWVSAALAVVVLISAGKVLRRRRAESDLDFWWQLVAPLSDRGGVELERAVERLASKAHVHPTLGRIRPTRAEILQWVALARAAESPKLQQLRRARHEALSPGVTDEVHPPSVGATATTPPSQGVTLVELVVVVALLGLAAGAAVLYLKPMAAPVRTAGELVEGLLRQARASAMATTTAHRVRPFSADELIVERARNCQAQAWTVDPRQDLELPRDVQMTSTDWAVCFNSRGTTGTNVVVTLDHPRFEARRLEILLGGAVRWLD